jgi:hypothetical protein
MVQVATAATCVLTRLVSRAVCRVAAVGRLAETAVDGPQRAGDMYQNPAARLWLIEDVGMYKPTVLRTGEPGTTEVVAFLSQVGSAGAILINDASAGLLARSPIDSRKGGNHGSDGHLVIHSASEYATRSAIRCAI